MPHDRLLLRLCFAFSEGQDVLRWIYKKPPARLGAHNKGQVFSTKSRVPFELVYWEGCLNQGDATIREKYLKSAWGKRYIKTRLRNYLTG
jgi:predicted GIY-YIG superfamily endonuclease